MSTQFYSAPLNLVQNVMGGTQLHKPRSMFQPIMNHQQAQWIPWNVPTEVPRMTMPWAMPASQQPDLVRFSNTASNMKAELHGKRKWEMATPDVVDFCHPRKQLITEEKMTQHFQDMHISNNTFIAQEAGPSTSTTSILSNTVKPSSVDVDITKTVEIDENKIQPRLIISDELKNIQTDPILPSSLLSKLDRPSMALVLWEPPSKHLRLLPTPRDTPTPSPIPPSGNNNSMNTNENNNNESIPDLNQTMDVISNDPALEPMDL
ncbi:von Willebrand factor A domain-containing protein DDB_G0286969-like isoform X2 [Phymastichus coffea]|nr:von Willebrand factor A domain-containing protein DDB_G0286969-like isoform X2 [Phymastichus coffea]